MVLAVQEKNKQMPMDSQTLYQEIIRKNTFLCIGLDSDIQRLPDCVKNADDPVFEFNRRIIDATRDYCIAYKLNTAFYEANGASGWLTMDKTIRYIGKTHLTIADAKRGDIGNTCDQYARAFFETMDCDAITLAPYMGSDSITPFLKYQGRYAIVLGLTSNPSATEFQYAKDKNDNEWFLHIIQTAAQWGNANNMMFVVGATRADRLADIRKIIPDHFLLIPGIGTQGGSLEDVVKFGINKQVGLLVNSSRTIIFASTTSDFDRCAADEAIKISKEMALLLQKYTR